MSKEVDEKVVQMQFDNAQFEKNVKTSMSTIDQLKKSLNPLGMTKGLEDVNKASKNIDFSVLSSSLENVGSKFSAMSVIAFGALAEIGRKVTNLGHKLVNDLAIAPVTDGFREYELKMGSVQTIMAGTGESLDVVMDKLNALNAYSDRTIYSFADMTTNIGKFTNAGVNLNTAVSAIQGVANVAAVSGANAAEASRAMYNFAQALSSGYVKLIDWKSIENANMATVEFKNQLLEAAVAAGTVEKTADGMYKVLGTNAQGGTMKETISATKNFNDSLSYQWMTTEVLTSTLAKYADETTDIGKKAFAAAQDVKTFSQLMDTLKEAVGSGWAETWENVFGNFDEAKQLWTSINNVVSGFIDRSSKARNEILATWKAAGGREDLLKAFSNIFGQVASLARAIRKEFTDMFPKATAGDLWKLTKRFRDFTETLNLIHAKFHAIRSQEGENIVKTFRGIFAVVGLVKDVVIALIKPFGALFSGMGKASNGILDLTANLGDYLVNLKDTVEQSGVLEEVTERLSKAFEAVGEFVSGVVTSIKSFIGGIKTGVGVGQGIIDFLFSMVENVTHLIFRLISALTGKDLMTTEIKVFSFLSKLWSGFSAFWSVIQPVLKGIANMFMGSFDAIKEAFEKLKDINFKPANDLKEKTEKTFSPLETFFGGIKKLFSGIGALFTAMRPVFSGIITAVGRVLEVVGGAISDIVKNFDFTRLGSILETGLKVGIGVKLFGFIDNLKNISEKGKGFFGQIKDMFEGITKLFASFKKMADAKTLEIKAKALKSIAVAVGILAVSLFILASIEPHRLQASMAAVTTLILELVGAMALLGKLNKRTNLKKIGTTMLGLAAAVLVLSLAIKAIGGLEPEQITLGLLAITALLAEMVIAAKALSGKKNKNMMDGAKNAVIFAVAIRVLAMSVKALGKLQPEQLINGMLGITGLIAEMVIAAKILSAGNANKMMKGATNAVIFAAAIRVLVMSVKALGKMQPEQLINGMIGVTALVAEIVIASKIFSSGDSGKMMKGAANALIFAIALRVLVSSVKAIGKMPLDQMINGLAGVTALILVMVMASNAMKDSMKGSASMIVAAGAMMVLALALKVLGTLSWEQIGKGLAAVAGAFIIMGLAGLILKPLVPTILALAGAMALIGVSSMLFGTGVLLIAAGLAALSKSVVVVEDSIIQLIVGLITAIPEMVSALANSLKEAGTDIITCFVEIARAALIALKEIVPEAVAVLLELTISTLTALAENIQPIIEALLDIVVGVIKGLASGTPEIITAALDLLKAVVDAIMSAFDGMSVAELLEASAALALFGVMMGELAAISVLAMIAVLPLPLIGAKLSQFVEAAEPFLSRIQEVNPASLQGAKALAEMILVLTANGILDALTSWFTGGSSMVEFGQQLAEFAPYMKQYSDKIKGIDAGAVEASANAALALATMATNLPNSGGVVSWFAGENSLSDFADELVKFGPKMKEYADSVVGLNSAAVINSVIAAQAISSFADNLPNSGGVVSWFTGDNSISVFAEELAIFGPKLKEYADSVKGMDSGVVVRSMQAATAISEFAKNLPNEGGVVSWFTGDNSIADFGEGLAEFGSYLLEYSLAVQGINIPAFIAILPGLASLVSIAKDISAVNSSSVGTFAEGFVELATTGVNGFINAFTDSTPEIMASIETLLSEVLDYISSRTDDFKTAGTYLMDQFVAGVKSKNNAERNVFSTNLTSVIQTIRSYRQQFYQAATYLVEGYSNGIRNGTNSAVESARAMVRKTINAVNAEQQSASPAKKGIEAGSYLGEGYVIGIKSWITKAGRTGRDLASETIDATNAVISRIADYVDSGMDTQPTIRPVLDLTDVTNGFGSLNAMFSRRQAVGISARMGDIRSVNGELDPTATAGGTNYNFVQNNYSPKALSASEIYRNTRNQFSRMKGALPK